LVSARRFFSGLEDPFFAHKCRSKQPQCDLLELHQEESASGPAALDL